LQQKMKMLPQATCPHCQAEVSADAPEGLCPECLLRQAVEDSNAETTPPEEARTPLRGFVPPAPSVLAHRFPQLEILELIGQGGMGAVYKARQRTLDRLVAVKILPPEAAQDGAFAERFAREARSLARLSHANILTLHDFGETDGLFYFTMEFVAGKNLRQLLEAGALTQAQALRISVQVCDALEYAHDEGVVHRDIKPENILLDSRGRVKIADFGLAKVVGLGPACLSLTGSTDVMGTLYYMAPEQLLRARQVDHRADLYSLGVVLYEMLTGELPVGRFAPPSQRAAVDARLDVIVLRTLSREPEQRYQDAAAMKQELEAVLTDAAAVACASPLPATARPNWPCVRFTIPKISWTGAWVWGDIIRDETELIVEFTVVGASGGVSKHGEVRIPLGEIRMISCQTTSLPGLLRWFGAWNAEIAVKVFDSAVLAPLPAGKHGRGRFQIHRDDRAAAEQLVESIVRSPRLAAARKAPDPAAPPADADQVRQQLVAPGVGLLVTAGVALPATMVLGFLSIAPGAEGWLVPFFLLAAVGSGLILAGALQMMRGSSGALGLVAAILAVLSVPILPLSLPVGIWALVALNRPEVKRLPLGDGGVAGSARGPGQLVGKLGSWLRSFGGYFLKTFPGRASAQSEAQPNKDEPG
jgi:predicted Ser/Thr protein kinase